MFAAEVIDNKIDLNKLNFLDSDNEILSLTLIPLTNIGTEETPKCIPKQPSNTIPPLRIEFEASLVINQQIVQIREMHVRLDSTFPSHDWLEIEQKCHDLNIPMNPLVYGFLLPQIADVQHGDWELELGRMNHHTVRLQSSSTRPIASMTALRAACIDKMEIFLKGYPFPYMGILASIVKRDVPIDRLALQKSIETDVRETLYREIEDKVYRDLRLEKQGDIGETQEQVVFEDEEKWVDLHQGMFFEDVTVPLNGILVFSSGVFFANRVALSIVQHGHILELYSGLDETMTESYLDKKSHQFLITDSLLPFLSRRGEVFFRVLDENRLPIESTCRFICPKELKDRMFRVVPGKRYTAQLIPKGEEPDLLNVFYPVPTWKRS